MAMDSTAESGIWFDFLEEENAAGFIEQSSLIFVMERRSRENLILK
jgi:hypothetical protein